MARPLRVEFPGAIYHITSRGNKRQDIFDSDDDRLRFLLILESVIETYHWVCHAYCLMGNHYHLLIETPDGNLSAGMRDLNGRFTQISNRIHASTGHIFQGRFKAFLIEEGSYFSEVARYTVLNPVRAGMVKHPREWRWSSYRATAGEGKVPGFLSVRFLLDMLGKNAPRRRYIEYIEEGIHQTSPFDEAEHGYILGSPQFIYEVWAKDPAVEVLEEVNKSERLIGRPTLKEIFQTMQTRNERDDAVVFARMRCGYSVTDIARHLKVHRTTISKILSK
ncbi:MAG: hypothetical protein UY72_C0004G0010 [Candidatus Uhrbacteria bacterium GW2011_GWD2_52_7]|uniref:Transposase IS200-like domain-containing protein n=1 Tax=Candidatus Uhrbacteria bacterium GW2011_GWD2_52_7 TaxID=1618989 RepID=A0A0G1XIE4_9BACT|nr:MAG: hypothetical protein UY72_C0004G0010 [Candidatus Uhrbacteria bacterium GW2011_GWD2_52_7]